MSQALSSAEMRSMRRAFVLLLLLVFGYFSFLVFRPFVSYLFMGALFVYLLHPLHARLLRLVKRPGVAASLMLAFFVLALLGPLTWVGVEVALTASEAVEDFDAVAFVAGTDAVLDRVAGMLGIEKADGESTTFLLLNATLPELQKRAQAKVPSLLSFAGSLVVGLFVMGFVIFYGLLDGRRFVQYVKSAMPLDPHQSDQLILEIRRTVDAVFLGHIIVSVMQGTLGGIGFLLFGVPNAVFWGFLMILLSLIPVLGPPIIWIPGVAYLLLSGNTFAAVGLLLWSLLLVSTLDNVIRPKIIGSRADIHPLLVLVGVLGGIVAFGFIGFVLGPLVVSILVAVVNFWRSDYLPRLDEPLHPPPPPPEDEAPEGQDAAEDPPAPPPA